MKHSVDFNQNTWSVSAQQTLEYDIKHVQDVFFELANRFKGKRCLMFVDANVHRLYGEQVQASIHGELSYHVIAVSEGQKNFNAYHEVINHIHQFEPMRYDEPLCVIGGGVLSDIVGFAASTYRRGIPYIRVPTTLMAMIDAAIGVKTGINFAMSKNRIGSYFAASNTLIDTQFLATLPLQHIRNGLAEILKMALICDASLFDLIEQGGARLVTSKLGVSEDTALREMSDVIIHRSIELMLQQLAPNLLEKNLQRRVDFGHTWSPVIELSQTPPLLHGFAVNVDMAYSAILAEQRGLLQPAERARIFSVMGALGLPITHPSLEAELAWEAVRSVTKHRNGHQNVPLPNGIGHCVFVNDLDKQALAAALMMLKQLAMETANDCATA